MDISVARRTIDRFGVLRPAWRLSAALGETAEILAPQMRLNLDGRVACGGRTGAHRWDIREGRLVVLDRLGRADMVFDAAVDDPPPDTDPAGASAFEGAQVDAPRRRLRLAPVARVEQPPAAHHRVSPLPGPLAACRRNLVVVHAGPFSRHRDWERDIAERDRNWDLCVSWNGVARRPPEDDPCEFHAVQDGLAKWPAMHRLLHDRSAFARYEQVLLPDDDIPARWSAINAAFEEARDCDMLLSQPSFSNLGIASREIDRHRDGHRLRFAATVSSRMPIFSADALRLCAPSFGLALEDSAFERLWPALLAAPATRLGILDRSIVGDDTGPGERPIVRECGAILASFGIADAGPDDLDRICGVLLD